MGIDYDPVVYLEAENVGQLGIGDHADTDEHDLRIDLLAAGQSHGTGVAVVVGEDFLDLSFEPDIQSALAMFK